MKMHLITGISIFFLPFFSLHAGEVTISGVAKEYAGKEIVFNYVSDRITNTENELSRSIVGPDGTFHASFKIEETLSIYVHLGAYRITFYAEPGAQYDIGLPPRQNKTEADYLNPYFKEIEVHAYIRNASPDDLNIIMRMFDDSYGPYYDKFAQNIKSKENPALLDSTIVNIMGPFREVKNAYFLQYTSYKLGMLRHMAYQFKSKAMSDQYFSNRPILYQNPAYMELFNQVYDKFFMYFIRTVEGKSLDSAINLNKSLYRLKLSLLQNKVFKNDSLLELVILKNLYDEFYSNRFSRSAILNIIDTIIGSGKIQEHRLIAQNIRANITRLLAGYEPPQFPLLNPDSITVNLSDLKGKYVYLCFCSCFSYACLKDFDMLQRMHTKHSKYLQIVLISVDPDLNELRGFVSKTDYKWMFLNYGKHPEILKAYDIRGYPTYFLIDKEGKLLLSPAPSPFENIELKLFDIMRARGDI
jgi:peroxiredoxin